MIRSGKAVLDSDLLLCLMLSKRRKAHPRAFTAPIWYYMPPPDLVRRFAAAPLATLILNRTRRDQLGQLSERAPLKRANALFNIAPHIIELSPLARRCASSGTTAAAVVPIFI